MPVKVTKQVSAQKAAEREPEPTSDNREKADLDTKSFLRKERAALQQSVDSLKEEVRERREQAAVAAGRRAGLADGRTAAARRAEEARAGLERHRKMLALLPEGENNLARLRGIVKKSESRLAGLREQWREHREGLVAESAGLAEGLAAAERMAERRGQQPGVAEQLERVGGQVAAAGAERRRLVRVVAGLREGEPREAYTARILAILRQLAKLQAGVDAVIVDVKSVQKDINMLNGRLERTFLEICMTMKGKMSHKEPHVEHSLDLLRCANVDIGLSLYLASSSSQIQGYSLYPGAFTKRASPCWRWCGRWAPCRGRPGSWRRGCAPRPPRAGTRRPHSSPGISRRCRRKTRRWRRNIQVLKREKFKNRWYELLH
jgi:hypothetical protein